ncbi:unnamed protein product [Urochloa humidicola]
MTPTSRNGVVASVFSTSEKFHRKRTTGGEAVKRARVSVFLSFSFPPSRNEADGPPTRSLNLVLLIGDIARM